MGPRQVAEQFHIHAPLPRQRLVSLLLVVEKRADHTSELATHALKCITANCHSLVIPITSAWKDTFQCHFQMDCTKHFFTCNARQNRLAIAMCAWCRRAYNILTRRCRNFVDPLSSCSERPAVGAISDTDKANEWAWISTLQCCIMRWARLHYNNANM